MIKGDAEMNIRYYIGTSEVSKEVYDAIQVYKRDNEYLQKALDNAKYLNDLKDKKLKALKDIEDELGIDLVTLFKAIKNPVYIKETDITVWCSNRLINVLGQHFILVVGDTILNTADYGKTWALTKEELL